MARRTAGGFLALVILPVTAALAISAAAVSRRTGPAAPRVELVRVPGGGIQPQAATDARGGAHLVYLKGEPSACDLYYTRRGPGASAWSQPVRVNSEPESAVAIGTIRGGHLAVGKNGRIHVVWFGSSKSGVTGPNKSAPVLYSRLREAAPGGPPVFEAQRNLMRRTMHLDGGGSIAADAAGGVYVAWHAQPAGDGKGNEQARRLWVARSTDDGATFGEEQAPYAEPTGACPCCSTKALSDSKGSLHVLYRTASTRSNRDMLLISSSDTARTFRGTPLDPWPIDS